MSESTASRVAPPDVVEVDVDALRARAAQPGQTGRLLVVDRGVEAQVLGEPAALLVGPGDADDAQALDLPDLADERPDRPRRRGHHERLALLRLADLQQPDPGGEADVAEEAQVGERGRPGWAAAW